MSGMLLAAIVAINIVSIPQMVSFRSNMGYGTAGVLSGMAIAYFIRNDDTKMMWAILATIVAALLALWGWNKEPSVKESTPWYFAAWIIGIFGSLLPILWGLKQTWKPDEVNIPWGAIITIMLIIVFFLWLLLRKGSDDTESTTPST